VVSLISRCEKLGLVERRPGREDRRAVEVHLTAAGERLVETIALHHREEVKLLGGVVRELSSHLH
jgi:DNA-binding MarR family transcriptional regulator